MASPGPAMEPDIETTNAASTSDEASTSTLKESRKLPLQYTTFNPPPPLNIKYVSSSFIKTDAQTLAGRIAAMGNKAGGSSRAKRKADDDVEEDLDASDEDSEDQPQSNPASRTIIIHPGSTHIRVGLATDVAPVVWPSVIARRDRLRAPARRSHPSVDGDAQMADGKSSPTGESNQGQRSESIDGGATLLRSDLRSIMRNMKLRGVSNGKGLCASYNANVKPESIPSHNDFGDEWTPDNPKQAQELELGERALKLPSLSPVPGQEAEVKDKQGDRPWKLFRPFKAGKLNYAPYVDAYGPSTERALAADIAMLFGRIISAPREDLSAPGKMEEGAGQTLHGLGISAKDLPSYSVILVIPDLFPRDDIRVLSEILMVEMSFKQFIVQQESTAATYGAGMSSALVVHVGGERASVTCVDDGLLLQDTRMHLDYGGEDVTQFLYSLLQRANFAYSDCDPGKRIADAAILEDLKKQMITLDPTQLGMYVYNFFLRLPSAPTKKYEVRVYDEAILCGMAMFGVGVRVFDFARKERARMADVALAQKEEGEEDGDAFTSEKRVPVTAAMVSSVQHLMPQPQQSEEESSAEAAGTKGDAPTSEAAPPAASDSTPQLNVPPAPEEASGAPPSRGASVAPSMAAVPSEQGTARPKENGQTRTAPRFDVVSASSRLPLDVAIFHSLLLSSSATAQGPFPQAPTAGQMTAAIAAGEERMRRLAGNILVVGGSARIPGMGMAIEGRLAPHLEGHYTTKAQQAAAAAAAQAQAEAEAKQAAAAAAAAGEGDKNANASAPAPSKPSNASAAPAAVNASAPNISVIPPPRELDPTLLAWKGMAVLPRLDSVNDMWITREEWDLLGWKGVRDKSAFL